MELDTIVNELRVQQRRINAALVALVGTANLTPPTVQLIAVPMEPVRQHHARTRMTAGVKQKISIAMKRNWESRRKFTLSSTVKAKIAASQKARWALIKEVALQANAHAPVVGGNHATISTAA